MVQFIIGSRPQYIKHNELILIKDSKGLLKKKTFDLTEGSSKKNKNVSRLLAQEIVLIQKNCTNPLLDFSLTLQTVIVECCPSVAF